MIRDASEADAAACLAIYAPYVLGTPITFETEPPTAEEITRRIAKASATHAWLVLLQSDQQEDQQVVGYAYAGPFSARPAYRWSCEVSVYLDQACRRRGGGRALYEALLARLGARGFRTAAAGMTLPNEASARLHQAMGFEPVGVYRRIGYKFGAWHDVAWVQRSLSDSTDPPAEPR